MQTEAHLEAYISEHHAAILTGVDRCADRVCADWDHASVGDGRAVVDPLETCLEHSGILEVLPRVLADAARELGENLTAPPAPAPPYVAITSRGPVLRATLSDCRLVITLAVFTVEPDGYRRRDEIDIEVRVVDQA